MTSPYVTVRDKDNKGNLQYYVLQTAYPHYVGVVCTRPIPEALIQSPIAGYNLWVCFNGVLAGNFVPSHKDALQEMQVVFENMALWYLSERIIMDKKRFEKFKIK